MIEIFDAILPSLPDGNVLEIEIGLFWTAVLVETEGGQFCGLASTMSSPEHGHAGQPAVRDAGRLHQYSARKLAELVRSQGHTEVSVGLAAVNALLPRPRKFVDLPAEEYIARQGSQSRVAVIGHFPFVEALRVNVQELWVLELNPQDGDFPASSAPEIIPQADILAITSTSLINHTLDGILRHRKPGAKVMLLGPSTPLTPLLFDFGIHVLSGSIVEDSEAVLRYVKQGANFRQIKKQGIRLVTMESEQ